MPKRKNLKQSLKASDRRRRRRGDSGILGASSSDTAAKTLKASIDVTGLVVESILACHPTRDATIISALRGCLSGTTPSNQHAQAISGKLSTIEDRDDVEVARYRSSLKELMEMSGQHQDADNPAAFVSYLQLFT